MGSFGISVLGGGLDVRGIVDQLLFLEAAPIRRLDDKQVRVEGKIDAYNDLSSKLSDLLGKIGALNDAEKLATKLATSSDETVLTASATSTALNGTYQINVTELARLDSYVSDATFTSSDETIGTGSFDITIGSTTTTVTIDSTNNTLTGLQNTINSSGADVVANIVNDGSGFRLTITSKNSGSAGAITISNNTLTLSDGTTPFAFSRTDPTITDPSQLDAQFNVNGLAITSSSNKIEDVIEGVTLNLKSTGNTTLTVENDTDTVKSTIQDFVDAYNDAYSFINSQFDYIEGAGRGVLSADSLLRRIQSDLSSIVRNAVSGLAGPLNNLGAAGIDLQRDGTLQIDSDALDDNLENSFSDLQKLFVAIGETANSNVVFLGVGSTTEAGTYEVNISQVAESATITAPNAISTTLGVNETLTFTLGSDTSMVSLTSTMTIGDMVTAINNQFTTDGLALTASSDASDRLVITSDNRGASVSFTVVSDVDGSGTGIGTAGMSDSGVDLQGTFTDTATSMVYAATATGADVLRGDEGPVTDLRIQFLGSSTGSYGTIALTLGYAEQLERELARLTDSIDGPIEDALDVQEALVRGIEDDIASLEERLFSRELFLLEEFSRADQALRQLSQLQATIGTQITSL